MLSPASATAPLSIQLQIGGKTGRQIGRFARNSENPFRPRPAPRIAHSAAKLAPEGRFFLKTAASAAPSNLVGQPAEENPCASPSRSLSLLPFCALATGEDRPEPNPLIDYKGFLDNAAKVEKLPTNAAYPRPIFSGWRAEKCGTIVFDARSDSKFAMLHVTGAEASFSARHHGRRAC